MPTEFHTDRADFSKLASKAAQEQFYPKLFPSGKLSFADVTKTKLDMDYAIDVQVSLSLPVPFRAPLNFSIQERWRKPSYRGYGDITITEWNLRTNVPSELYKLAAQLFVYGFYDKSSDFITEAWAINVARLLRLLSTRELPTHSGSRPSKFDGKPDQSWVGIQVADLERFGLIDFHYTKDSDDLVLF